MSRLQCYSNFKNVFEVENNHSVIDIRKYSAVLTKCHSSNYSLCAELVRQKSLPYHLRFCEFCKFSSLNFIEDEFHMIVTCSIYTELKEKYIPYMVNGNYGKFIYLMSTKKLIETYKFIWFTVQLF